MQRIVTNRCYGGFGLSHLGIMRYTKIKGIEIWWTEDDQISSVRHYYTINPQGKTEEELEDAYWTSREIDRDDPVLVQTVEELGDDANGDHANLKITTIPDGVDWVIGEYDGNEWVAEAHRTW